MKSLPLITVSGTGVGAYIERMADALAEGGIRANPRGGSLHVYLGNLADCAAMVDVMAAFGQAEEDHQLVTFDGPGATVPHRLTADAAETRSLFPVYLPLVSNIGMFSATRRETRPTPTFADQGQVVWPRPITHAGSSADDEPAVLAFTEKAGDASAWSLVVVAQLIEPDARDVAYGFDTYCLVVEDTHPTYYGGVRHCELHEKTLRLAFTVEAAAKLDLPAEVVFPLQLTRRKYELLKKGLRRTLTSGRADTVPETLSGI
jgi:hypothetical protein